MPSTTRLIFGFPASMAAVNAFLVTAHAVEIPKPAIPRPTIPTINVPRPNVTVNVPKPNITVNVPKPSTTVNVPKPVVNVPKTDVQKPVVNAPKVDVPKAHATMPAAAATKVEPKPTGPSTPKTAEPVRGDIKPQVALPASTSTGGNTKTESLTGGQGATPSPPAGAAKPSNGLNDPKGATGGKDIAMPRDPGKQNATLEKSTGAKSFIRAPSGASAGPPKQASRGETIACPGGVCSQGGGGQPNQPNNANGGTVVAPQQGTGTQPQTAGSTPKAGAPTNPMPTNGTVLTNPQGGQAVLRDNGNGTFTMVATDGSSATIKFTQVNGSTYGTVTYNGQTGYLRVNPDGTTSYVNAIPGAGSSLAMQGAGTAVNQPVNLPPSQLFPYGSPARDAVALSFDKNGNLIDRSGPQLQAATGPSQPYVPVDPDAAAAGLAKDILTKDPGVAGNLTICTGICGGAGGTAGANSGGSDRLTTGVGLMVDGSVSASTDAGGTLPKGTTLIAAAEFSGIGVEVSANWPDSNTERWNASASVLGVGAKYDNKSGLAFSVGPVEVSNDTPTVTASASLKLGVALTYSEESNKFFGNSPPPSGAVQSKPIGGPAATTGGSAGTIASSTGIPYYLDANPPPASLSANPPPAPSPIQNVMNFNPTAGPTTGPTIGPAR